LKDVLLNLLLQTPGSSNPILGFLPIILIFGIFYFLLFLPMQRQKKQQQKMLKELQSGERVITNGGLVGTIVKIDDETLVIRVKPDNVKIEVTRSAVASKIGEEGEKK
jgi:preprotein translocase subunit YajC